MFSSDGRLQPSLQIGRYVKTNGIFDTRCHFENCRLLCVTSSCLMFCYHLDVRSQPTQRHHFTLKFISFVLKYVLKA